MADVAAAAKLDYLSEDEIVQLSIKPSLWYIPIVCARDIAILIAAAGIVWFVLPGGETVAATLLTVLLLLGALLRIAMAALQWASRLYILTNRRVMCFSGIIDVKISECHLKRVGHTHLGLAPYQQIVRLGSIVMTPDDSSAEPVVWQHIAKPGEIYQIVVRAVRKSRDNPGG